MMGHGVSEQQDSYWLDLATLWSELAEHPESDVRGACTHFMNRMCALLDADYSFTVIAGRRTSAPADEIDGWSVFDVFHSDDSPDAIKKHGDHYFSSRELLLTDPGIVRLAQDSNIRAYLRNELYEPEELETTASQQAIKRIGVSDRIISAMPVSDWAEVYFGYDLASNGARFSETDRDLTEDALRGLSWLGRNIALCYGLLFGNGALAPREREALTHLLNGLSEKQVAAVMDITKASAHQYVVSIYRKLGVRSRGELTALWINRGKLPEYEL
jgi:DNA-binding NarL/FixJ family response regulator